jgi:hypothetical protein
MKKKIFGGIALLAIAAMAAWNVNLNSQPSNKLSDTMLANIEALAGENGTETEQGWRSLTKKVTDYIRDDNGNVIRTEEYDLLCCINNGPLVSCTPDPGC